MWDNTNMKEFDNAFSDNDTYIKAFDSSNKEKSLTI